MSEVAEKIQSMVGLTLSGIGRALDMGIFEFGEDVEWTNPRTQQVDLGSEYAIHLQCPFRVTRKGRILVGSCDISTVRYVLADGTSRQADS